MNTIPPFTAEFLDSLAEERGQSLFDALRDVRFFIKDTNGIYRHSSRVMHLSHGFPDPSGIVGRTDHDFIPSYLADHYQHDDLQVLNGREIWGQVELVTRHPGCPDWHVTSKIPLFDANGRIMGLAGVSRDLRMSAQIVAPFGELAPVLDHIRRRFAEPVEVEELARLVGMSARTLQRRFKRAFHITPTSYLRQFRMGKACQMLIETDETITGIAFAVGFSDHSHLVREFTRQMRMPPGAWRKRYRRA